jgi:cobalt-zinc-cadmium efflux system outer membrane protein
MAKSEEVTHLKDELLPESEKTLQASRDAYRMGKLSFLEVLDSQRTLFELSTRFVSTLADYHKDWNELQSLVSSGRQKNQGKAEPQ